MGNTWMAALKRERQRYIQLSIRIRSKIDLTPSAEWFSLSKDRRAVAFVSGFGPSRHFGVDLELRGHKADVTAAMTNVCA